MDRPLLVLDFIIRGECDKSSRFWGIAKLFIFLIKNRVWTNFDERSQITLDNDNVPKQNVDHTRT